ncbi:MAG: hydrogenase maturation protease [Methanomicrobiaceae archaeon]|nr:hydrogenase maturation protease [Methanomicrobiaceae archaeon]
MHGGRVRVIACGNPLLGNDGVGIRVMQMLQEKYPDIDAVEGGTGGLGLIPLMEGYDKVVILDAMVGIGDRIGEVRTFRTPPPTHTSSLTLHDPGIGEVLLIAREIGMMTEVVTIGIEVGAVGDYSTDIDPELEVSVHDALRCVEKEIMTRNASENPDKML